MKISPIQIYLTLFIFSKFVVACQEPNHPDLENLGLYSGIHIGEVTSVSLKFHEYALLTQKTRIVKDQEGDFVFYSMNAVISETIHGEEKSFISKDFSHCGTFVPELGSIGIFFIGADEEIYPVYSNNGFPFLNAIQRITRNEN